VIECTESNPGKQKAKERCKRWGMRIRVTIIKTKKEIPQGQPREKNGLEQCEKTDKKKKRKHNAQD